MIRDLDQIRSLDWIRGLEQKLEIRELIKEDK